MKQADAAEATRNLLRTLWEKNLPITRARIEEIVQTADAALSGSLSDEARLAARNTAHKLAGSLGMFGYPRGTEAARAVEQLLEKSGDLDAGRLMELALELRAEVPV